MSDRPQISRGDFKLGGVTYRCKGPTCVPTASEIPESRGFVWKRADGFQVIATVAVAYHEVLRWQRHLSLVHPSRDLDFTKEIDALWPHFFGDAPHVEPAPMVTHAHGVHVYETQAERDAATAPRMRGVISRGVDRMLGRLGVGRKGSN